MGESLDDGPSASFALYAVAGLVTTTSTSTGF